MQESAHKRAPADSADKGHVDTSGLWKVAEKVRQISFSDISLRMQLMLYYGKIMFYGAEGMRMRVSGLFHAKGPNST